MKKRVLYDGSTLYIAATKARWIQKINCFEKDMTDPVFIQFDRK